MLIQFQNFLTFENIYLWANFGVLPFWLMLFFIPNSQITRFFINSIILPLFLSAAYLYVIYQTILLGDDLLAIFNLYLSLDDLYTIFATEGFLLVFWLHFISLNLFLGLWVSRDGNKYNIPKALIMIPLFIIYFAVYKMLNRMFPWGCKEEVYKSLVIEDLRQNDSTSTWRFNQNSALNDYVIIAKESWETMEVAAQQQGVAVARKPTAQQNKKNDEITASNEFDFTVDGSARRGYWSVTGDLVFPIKSSEKDKFAWAQTGEIAFLMKGGQPDVAVEPIEGITTKYTIEELSTRYKSSDWSKWAEEDEKPASPRPPGHAARDEAIKQNIISKLKTNTTFEAAVMELREFT